MWSDDPAANYGRVTVPVSLIVAGKTASEDVDLALENLPVATASWFPNAHHDIHLQQPELVTEQLFALLERVQGSAE
jgi:pimeloyl-ACP methyl ester carboxylesterase